MPPDFEDDLSPHEDFSPEPPAGSTRTPLDATQRGVSPLVVLLLLVVVAALLLRYRVAIWRDLHDPNAVPRAVTPRGDLAPVEQAQIAIFKQASPSVVYINSSGPRMSGSGTGFVWDKRGYIVTNYHVVAGGSQWHVTLADNSTYEASYVGGEAASDVAVLKIAAEPGQLTPITIGSSGDLQVGQNAYSIGSPFGLEQTLTTGVISGLGRQIESMDGHPIENVIQTDAAINPGNSGGPLLDSSGRAIGMNTAIFSPSGANAGIGFAIPIDTINRLVPELIRTGSIERPAIGVYVFSEAYLAELRRRGVRNLPDAGVVISEVLPGGSAAEAGLRGTEFDPRRGVRLGDVIVGVDGTPIDTAEDLFREIGKHQVGDAVVVSLLRDGQPMQVTLTLRARPPARP